MDTSISRLHNGADERPAVRSRVGGHHSVPFQLLLFELQTSSIIVTGMQLLPADTHTWRQLCSVGPLPLNLNHTARNCKQNGIMSSNIPEAHESGV